MEMFKLISLSVVLLILQVSRCNSKPTEEDESRYKKIKDSDVRHIVAELTKIIEELKLDQFVGDTVLKQKVEGLNDYTKYRLSTAGKNAPSLYERNSNDKDKDAIVLLPSEDKISVKKNKKVYVGLRFTGADEGGREYYVFYIYLRLVKLVKFNSLPPADADVNVNTVNFPTIQSNSLKNT